LSPTVCPRKSRGS